MKEIPNEIRIEDHRFIISPNSMDIMKKERAYFEEKQKEIPELSGITFFGSRTLNREKEKSDLDMCIFYDGSSSWELKDDKIKENQHKVLIIENKIHEVFNFNDFNINFDNQEEHTATFLIDVSPYNISHIINRFQKLTKDQESNSRKKFDKDFTPAEGWDIVSIFFIGVGERLYNTRKEIFDILEKLPDGEGEIIWNKIVDYLSAIERDKKTPKRDPLPSFNNYPRTIDKAREYFHSEQI